MEPNKILQSDLLDLVFEKRNKEYGAYELRKKYNKRITLALMITGGILVAILGASLLSNAFSGPVKEVNVRDVVIENIRTDEPPPPPPPPPPPKVEPPPQVEMAKFTPPVIKKDEDVKPEEVPPVDELKDQKIAAINQEGVEDLGIVTPPVVDAGTGVVEAPKVEDENKIFEKVEIEPSVDKRAWTNHLQRNLQRPIEDATAQGMPPGTYSVQVRFLVEKDGSIQDVKALSDPGFGLSKAAVDVVKKGPKWSPGIQNGRPARTYHTQPVVFVVSE